MNKPVRDLRNIGPKTAEWLESVGIQSEADIIALGVIEVYRRVKATYPDRVSLNLLWGLQAALLDMPWNALPDTIKHDLRRQLDA